MYLKTALSNIRRTPFQAIAAILPLVVTFFVASLIAILVYSSAQVLNYFETRPQVITFLKSDAKDSDIQMLENKLKADTRVKDVKFISKEEALSIYKSATSDNPLLSQLVSPSIFPASIEFSLNDLSNAQKLIDEVKGESVVDSVGFTASLGSESTLKDVISRLTKITFYIRVGGIILGSILAFTSFVVLLGVIGMKTVGKRAEIETLRLMGASASFIQTPVFLEALIYVILGVLVGWFFALILILYAAPTLINYFGVIPVLPHQSLAFFELIFGILGIELFVGFVIALCGGWVASRRAVSK